MRLRISAAGWDEPKNILIKDSSCYIWYGDNTKTVYKAALGAALEDGGLYDALQMVPTYEDVLELDKEDILEAAYVELPEGWRVKVAAEDPVLGYTSYTTSLIHRLLEAPRTTTAERCFQDDGGPTALTGPTTACFYRLNFMSTYNQGGEDYQFLFGLFSR
jgi:hypothetical protein